MVFSRQSSIVTCQNLKGCDICCIPEKTAKECIDAASDITFTCYDIIEGPELGTTSVEADSRAMCMVM